MSGRSFGGYSYRQSLGTGVFGEVYRAVNGAGAEARIVHVARELAARPAFARALVRLVEKMAPLAAHRNVIAIRQVGRSGGELIVVTDPAAGQTSLAELLARGGCLPPEVALAIGLGAIDGLAQAHRFGIAHGAVHPRSVLVEPDGNVALADFALSRALVEAAQDSDEAGLLHGLRGYLAPELAVGQPPGERSDVYAAGALLHELLHGEPPPGELRATPRVAQVLARALATDAAQRLADAGELRARLEEAIAADGCPVATAEQVARVARERLGALVEGLHAAADEAPHGADERFHAAAPDQGLRRGGPGRGLGAAASDDALHAATDDLLAALAPAAASEEPAGAARFRSDRVNDLLAQLDPDDDAAGDMTDVDPHGRGRGDRDLSAVFRLDSLPVPRARVAAPDEDESTPLPAPTPHRPGSVTRHLGEVGAEEPAPRGRRPVRSAGELAGGGDLAATAPAPAERRSRALPWVALTMFGLGALGAVLYTQSDWFDPGRRSDQERAAADEEAAAVAQHEQSQPRAAELTVTASEPDAAVWLLLGRTPLDSMPMSAAMVHELRLDHEGYRPLDVRVDASRWKRSGEALRAEVEATLVEGSPRAPMPAYPPAAGSAALAPGEGRGRGVVRVRSRPPGARVWLLIGFTPRATISGLEAGRDYELKVMKDGFRPGSAAVRGEEWYLSGPDGPILTSLTREVSLARIERRPGRAHRRARSRRGASGRD